MIDRIKTPLYDGESYDEMKIGHERYETARRMNPRQWAEAWELNLKTGKPFDDIIDEMIDGVVEEKPMDDDSIALRRVIEQRDSALKEIQDAWEAIEKFGIVNDGKRTLAEAINKLFPHSETSEINALLAEKLDEFKAKENK